MSPDPDQKAEGLLRSYADKRRREFPGPFALHPATRRLFQDEVKREYRQVLSERIEKSDRRSSPLVFRYLVGAACAGFAALVIIIAIRESSVRGLPQLAQNNGLSNLTPTIASPTAPAERSTVDPNSGILFRTELHPADPTLRPPQNSPASIPETIPLDPALRLKMADSASPPGNRPSPASAPAAPGFSTSSFPPIPDKRAGESAAQGVGGEGAVKELSDQRVTPALTVQEAAVLARSTRSNLILAEAAPRISGAAWRFIDLHRTAAGSESAPSSKASSNGVPPILTSFVLERTGERIRVRDADGSIYDGAVLPAMTNSTDARQFAANRSQTVRADLRAESSPDRLTLRNEVAVPAFWFQVAGTNPALNQRVVFEGAVLSTAGEIPAPLGRMLAQAARSPRVNPRGEGAEPAPSAGPRPTYERNAQEGEAGAELRTPNDLTVNPAPPAFLPSGIEGILRTGTNQENIRAIRTDVR